MEYHRSRAEAREASAGLKKARADALASRVPALVARFDGAIKYTPMILDHPEWTDDQCLEFARKWHAVAIEQLKTRGLSSWNDRVPYCRNLPTVSMLREAGVQELSRRSDPSPPGPVPGENS